MPDPTRPSHFHAHSPSTLTEDSVIPFWTYSSPLLCSWPCTAPSSYKASHQCIVESVQISTKFPTKFVSSCSLKFSPSLSSLEYSRPPFPLLQFVTMPLQNTGPNNSSGAAHMLKPGPSVCITSRTPSLPGPELVHPFYNIEGISWD